MQRGEEQESPAARPSSFEANAGARIARLERELGLMHTKGVRAEIELNAARHQIAWLSRQLFGVKAERVDSAQAYAEWAQVLCGA